VKYLDLLPFTTVPVNVTNTGSVTSDFVVLAFLKGEFGPKPYPRKSLVAFSRLHNVPPGGSGTASLGIKLGSVARSDEKGDLVLFPGKYSLILDVGERETPAWEFTIVGEEKVLDSWPAR
jgi:xylan 1,4-beta-xylosidase